MTINAKVVDIYQFDANNRQGGDGADFTKVYGAGIRGVIHKATQFTADHLYHIRRAKAIDAGLLWGAYHFNTQEDVTVQAHRFLSVAQPDKNTLCALDLEDYHGRPMNLAKAKEFMEIIDRATGNYCVLYSGNVIKELIAAASPDDRAFFAKHPLWLAQYAAVPSLKDYNHRPMPWTEPFLWQFTGDGLGPSPHAIPGLQNNMDINHFNGSDQDLVAKWVVPVSE